MKFFLTTLFIVAFAAQVFAHANYIGRSGAPGRTTCASSCHGVNGGTAQISGFPTNYTPNQTYTLTIQRLSGNPIVNFNASCRVGTGTVNAGVIAAGTGTSTYNTTGETNGVHFTAQNQVSGTFQWTAPAAGTGTVRLYAGAIQTDVDGENTTIVLVSNEAVPLPGIATNPAPANHAVDIAANIALNWTPGALATSHDIFFGTVTPPPFVVNQNTVGYDPPGDLIAGQQYYWQITERNAAGATTGEIWEFTVFAPVAPAAPDSVVIQPFAGNIRLAWGPVPGANEYRIYRDTAIPVGLHQQNEIGATIDTSFIDLNAVSLPNLKFYYAVTAAN